MMAIPDYRIFAVKFVSSEVNKLSLEPTVSKSRTCLAR